LLATVIWHRQKWSVTRSPADLNCTAIQFRCHAHAPRLGYAEINTVERTLPLAAHSNSSRDRPYTAVSCIPSGRKRKQVTNYVDSLAKMELIDAVNSENKKEFGAACQVLLRQR
jgi:hypothetical protein